MTDSNLLAIGDVAARAGVATSTLRYYEREGLLPAPARESGRRRYERAVLQRLAVIDVAKRAGFTLAEIRQLLEGFEGAMPSSERWRDMAARKLPEIDVVIQDAQRMRRLLTEGLASVRLPSRPWGYPSPYAYRRGPGLTVATLLFDTLVWRVPSGELRPWLARRWDVSPDGLEHRFALRDDVSWHDGRPLTAADVVFTFESLERRSDLIQLDGLEAVSSVEASDPHEVTVRLRRPYAAFGDFVAGRIPIVPAHIWSGVPDAAALRGPEAVLGSGPYRLESCDEVQGRYRFRANDDYFHGPPYVRSLTFEPVADQLEALARGQVDAAVYVSDANRPSAAELSRFEGPRYRLESRYGEWTRALHFALAPPSPFSDPRVRRAIAHAVDRHEMVRHLLAGMGRPASHGGLAPTHPATPPDLPCYPHDVEAARTLLDAAGLPERGGHPVRLRPDGTPLRIRLLTEATDPGAAELVQRDLGRVGIDVEVHRLPPVAADAASLGREFEAALVGYGGLGGDPDVLRLRLSSALRGRVRTRAHGYGSERFEELALRQSTTLDPQERGRLVSDLQRVVANDLPTVALYVPDQLTISPALQVFTAWEPTQGGVWGGYPGPLNKHSFITGQPPA